MRINGAIRRPAVCYALTDDVAAAVERLSGEGQARIYDEEVRFVSGRALPVKRAPAPEPAIVPAAPAPMFAPAAPAQPETVAEQAQPEAVAETPSEPVAEQAQPVAVAEAPSEPVAEQAQPVAVAETPSESVAVEESADSGDESGSGRKSSRRTK
jgi:hypothetical protein